MPIAKQVVLFAGCLPEAPFAEYVDAAASVGFDAVTISPAMYRRATSREALDPSVMRRMLDDAGVGVTAIEACGDWLPDSDELGRAGPLRSVWRRDQFFDTANELGAACVVAAHLGRGAIDWAAAVDSFGQLCRDADQQGLSIALEFLPFSGLPDADLAWQLIEAAECENAGLVVDTSHLHRTGGLATLAAAPIDRIEIVQLADGTQTAPDDLVDEAIARRIVPGAGEFGIAELIERLDAAGARASVGPEVARPEWSDREPVEVAAELMRATRQVLSLRD